LDLILFIPKAFEKKVIKKRPCNQDLSSAESEGVEPMLSIACPIRDLFLKVANAPNNAPDKT
jgi:hypothetical protein